jgi:hypothetical protein
MRVTPLRKTPAAHNLYPNPDSGGYILRASRKASHRSAAVHSRASLLSRISRRLRASASDCVEELSELSISFTHSSNEQQ